MVTAKKHHVTRNLRRVAIVVAAVVASVVVAITLMDETTPTVGITTSVTVNNLSCADGWLPPHSGRPRDSCCQCR